MRVAHDGVWGPGIVWRSAEWRGETAALTDAGRQDPTGKQREGAGTVSPQRKHHRLQRKWAGGQTRGSVCMCVCVFVAVYLIYFKRTLAVGRVCICLPLMHQDISPIDQSGVKLLAFH